MLKIEQELSHEVRQLKVRTYEQALTDVANVFEKLEGGVKPKKFTAQHVKFVCEMLRDKEPTA